MKTGIFLSYKGLGANLLHLSYCHQIAKKFGKVELITLCPNLNRVLIDDPLIKSVNYLDKFHRNFFDIINLSVFIKKFNFFLKEEKTALRHCPVLDLKDLLDIHL